MSSDPSTSGSRHAPGPHDKTLARDVQATLIPAGEPAVLPAGTFAWRIVFQLHL